MTFGLVFSYNRFAYGRRASRWQAKNSLSYSQRADQDGV
jgi:hypothetical protein